VLVTTNEPATGTRLAVFARSDDEFVAAWQSMVDRPTAMAQP